MRIVDVKETTVSIAADVGNAIMTMAELTTSMVALVTDVVRDGRSVVGYGFSAYGRYGQGGLMRERFIPRLLKAAPESLLTDAGDNFDPARIWSAMMRNEKPGGHGERSVAVGTLDMAVWDAVAKIEGKPLNHLLAERFGDGTPLARVPVYVGGGYYNPENDIALLKDEMQGYLDLGFTDVKLKIGGASLAGDMARIEAVLPLLPSGRHLSVDASARFDLETGLAYGEAITPYGLRWYEDVCDPLDYETQRGIADAYGSTLATGESLFSTSDARNLIRYGGLRPEIDCLLFDVPHSYGLVEYLRTLDMLAEHGWSRRRCWPHGGHLFSLQLASGLGLGGTEAHPGIFQPFARFADTTPVENGSVALPDVPGIGFEAVQELDAMFAALAGV